MAQVPAQADGDGGFRTRRRPPIQVSFNEKVTKALRAATYVHNAMDDNRWNANRENLSAGCGADLLRTIIKLTEVYEALQAQHPRRKDT
jgi:hypothetical protein